MSTAGLISSIIGGIAVLGGVFAVIYATGALEYLGGRKKPKVDSVIRKEALLEQILKINSPDLPYQIKPAEKTDLEVSWKILDARWLGIFARERVRKTYHACMVLDQKRHALRYWEAIEDVDWVAGAPKVHYQSDFFRNRIIYQKSYGVQYGMKEDKTFGKVYEYKFDANDIRGPIRIAALEGGWEFVEVQWKSHAMKR